MKVKIYIRRSAAHVVESIGHIIIHHDRTTGTGVETQTRGEISRLPAESERDLIAVVRNNNHTLIKIRSSPGVVYTADSDYATWQHGREDGCLTKQQQQKTLAKKKKNKILS